MSSDMSLMFIGRLSAVSLWSLVAAGWKEAGPAAEVELDASAGRIAAQRWSPFWSRLNPRCQGDKCPYGRVPTGEWPLFWERGAWGGAATGPQGGASEGGH